jgi:hypothetical protein
MPRTLPGTQRVAASASPAENTMLPGGEPDKKQQAQKPLLTLIRKPTHTWKTNYNLKGGIPRAEPLPGISLFCRRNVTAIKGFVSRGQRATGGVSCTTPAAITAGLEYSIP